MFFSNSISSKKFGTIVGSATNSWLIDHSKNLDSIKKEFAKKGWPYDKIVYERSLRLNCLALSYKFGGDMFIEKKHERYIEGVIKKAQLVNNFSNVTEIFHIYINLIGKNDVVESASVLCAYKYFYYPSSKVNKGLTKIFKNLSLSETDKVDYFKPLITDYMNILEKCKNTYTVR